MLLLFFNTCFVHYTSVLNCDLDFFSFFLFNLGAKYQVKKNK